MANTDRNRIALGALAIMALVPLFTQHSYYLFVANVICVNAILVLALNFILGFAGQVFLGTVGFFAVAAYLAALMMVKVGASFWLAILVSIVGTMLLSVVIGLPSLRVSGFYLALMSTGFIAVVNDVLRNWSPVTGGVFGIMGIPRPTIFGFRMGSNLFMYIFSFVMLALVAWLAIRIEDSRFGRAFKAVRDDELALEMLGVSATYTKVLAFVIAGFYTGIAGSLFVSLHGFVSPEVFTSAYNSLFMCMLVVGGLSTIPGAITGAMVLTVLTEVLRPLREKYLTVFALMILLVLRYEPGGLYTLLRATISRFRGRRLRRQTPPAVATVGGEASAVK